MVAAVAAVGVLGAFVLGWQHQLGGGSGSTAAGPAASFAAGAATPNADTVSSSRAAGPELSLQQAAVIRKGSLSMTTGNIAKARHAIMALLDSLGGYLASEHTQASGRGAIDTAALLLKVPSPRFDTAMSRLSQLADVRSRTQSATDVTRQVADVNSRVASARAAALTRVRLLLDRANALGSVIRLESALSDRQAALESLLAQQKALQSQTQMSTIDVDLRLFRGAPPAPPDRAGFRGGLAQGWHALTAILTGLATAAGALLPFALLLVLLGLPAWLVVRRVRGGRRRGPVQTG